MTDNLRMLAFIHFIKLVRRKRVEACYTPRLPGFQLLFLLLNTGFSPRPAFVQYHENHAFGDDHHARPECIQATVTKRILF